jgi:hypothetical protein
MKNFSQVILLLMALFVTPSIAAEILAVASVADSEDGEENTFTTVIEAKLRKESPKADLIFELESFEQDDRCFTKTITAKFDGNLIATLHTEAYNDDEYAWRPSREALVIVEDMNFDGFADIRIQAFLGAGPNIPYIVWLFNPRTNTYDHSPSLSDIPSFEVDSENQWIRSEARVSATVYTESFYRYVDGELTLFRESVTDYEKNEVVTSELKNGEMSVVNTKELE